MVLSNSDGWRSMQENSLAPHSCLDEVSELSVLQILQGTLDTAALTMIKQRLDDAVPGEI
jgi:hypothetical protein